MIDEKLVSLNSDAELISKNIENEGSIKHEFFGICQNLELYVTQCLWHCLALMFKAHNIYIKYYCIYSIDIFLIKILAFHDMRR